MCPKHSVSNLSWWKWLIFSSLQIQLEKDILFRLTAVCARFGKYLCNCSKHKMVMYLNNRTSLKHLIIHQFHDILIFKRRIIDNDKTKIKFTYQIFLIVQKVYCLTASLQSRHSWKWSFTILNELHTMFIFLSSFHRDVTATQSSFTLIIDMIFKLVVLIQEIPMNLPNHFLISNPIDSFLF